MEQAVHAIPSMEEEQIMTITYHEMRQISKQKARELVRKVLENTGGDVSKTARILQISRKTVRRARDGTLSDYSRRPVKSPRRIDPRFEQLIVFEGKRTGYRAQRLSSFLFQRYGHEFSMYTVKKVLKRNSVKKKKIRTKAKTVRHLYDYEHLSPFREFQLDTKHILDQKALPEDVYNHILHNKLPKYEWNMIDAATRARFTAYSHNLDSTFGFSFIIMVLLWLRGHNVRDPIHIQTDNGAEFCMGSRKKEDEWNTMFALLDARLSAIPPGAKHLQAIVENSHRKDDECFLSIHPKRCNDTYEFLHKAQRWQDTWNTARPSYGIAMNGNTPLQKLRGYKTMIHSHVFTFPVLLMEDVIKMFGTAVRWFETYFKLNLVRITGTYVRAMCQFY
jgi:putative transposase